MYIRRPNSPVLVCSAATRRGHGHNIPAVTWIDRKNFNMNADTGVVIAALPIGAKVPLRRGLLSAWLPASRQPALRAHTHTVFGEAHCSCVVLMDRFQHLTAIRFDGGRQMAQQ